MKLIFIFFIVIILLYSFRRESSHSNVEIYNNSDKSIIIDSFQLITKETVIESKPLNLTVKISSKEWISFKNEELIKKISSIRKPIFIKIFLNGDVKNKIIQKKIDKNLYLNIAKIKIH